jgi:hypothetical protein
VPGRPQRELFSRTLIQCSSFRLSDLSYRPLSTATIEAVRFKKAYKRGSLTCPRPSNPPVIYWNIRRDLLLITYIYGWVGEYAVKRVCEDIKRQQNDSGSVEDGGGKAAPSPSHLSHLVIHITCSQRRTLSMTVSPRKLLGRARPKDQSAQARSYDIGCN